MPELNQIDQTDIAEKVLNVIEALVATSSIEGLRCEYEYLPTAEGELPCISMATLPGKPIEKEYLDGSYIANYRFALNLRQVAIDERARLDARKVLNDLADVFISTPLDFGSQYAIWKRMKEVNPARVAADEKYLDYQVTLLIQYKSHH